MLLEPILNQVSIDAARITLRPLQPSDAGPIRLNAADKRVAEATSSIPHPLPPGSARGFVARALAPERTEDIWAIDGTKSERSDFMGIISLSDLGTRQSNIGYWIATAYWNTGIASEAVQALVQANPQGCRTIFASVFQDNPASARVLTNCGFQYIGDAESFCVARGCTVATWTYTLKCD